MDGERNMARTGIGGRRLRARVVAAALAAVPILGGFGWWMTLPPRPDAFYTAPEDVPSAPGRLVRVEPFERSVPAGSRAWRILHTTSRHDGSPAVASGVVIVPDGDGARPRPVVAWAHGTTGIAAGCAPSLQNDPFAGVPGLPDLLSEGWAFVATDYAGLGTTGGHAYLVGEDAARSILDAVRAATASDLWDLDGRAVVWGHSQGGHGALWAGMRAPEHAPELRLAGVAAMAPASDLAGLLDAAGATPFGRIVSSFLYVAYRGVYPDVDATIAGPAGRFIASEIARRCITDRKVLWSVAAARLLPAGGLFVRSPAEGPLGLRLARNTPEGPVRAPLLVLQGGADDAVPAGIQRRYVAARCKAGQAVDYREYPGLDHGGIVAPGAAPVSDLLEWTRARFAGRTPRDTCPRP